MAEGVDKQKSRRGYHRLLSRQFSFSSSSEKAGKEELKRSTSVKPKAHPLLKLLDAKNLEKAAKRPEFLRYLEYMKEGGSWDSSADRPVMHFK